MLFSFTTSAPVVRGFLLLLLCAFAGLAFNSASLYEVLNLHWIDLQIRNRGLHGAIYFLLIAIFATSVGCPRQLVAFSGGYTYGFVKGCLLSTLSAGVGCILVLLLARTLIRPLVTRLYPDKIISVNRFLSTRPIVKTIVIRLLPVGNNLVTNLAAGVTTVKVHHFAIGSVTGYLPQMIIFALMGSGVSVLSAWKMTLSIVLFFISSALCVWLYQEYRELHAPADVEQSNCELLSNSIDSK